ncbi:MULTISPECIES: hypothetical protein [unclassified Streptomyces]|uniref:hypothetical protein n=1 Tax=unclassified Streptomyces TaxID=2593676 RepID=UPI002E2A411F|nr:hypothetical protein [Streptomyces sp. NBC_01439]
MRVAWKHEAAQLRDAAIFIGLSNPVLWSGPPVRESEIAAWTQEVKFFTTIEIDSVLTVHSRSGNAFELYGKGRNFLNPVTLARYAPYAIEAESAPENPEILARARTVWQEYVDGIARRIGAPLRVTPDDAEVPEAVWRPGGEEGPNLRLWMNASYGLDPDGPLFTKVPGRVLVRLDAHVPADMVGVTPRELPEVSDLPEWIPDWYQEHAVEQARREHEAPDDDDRLLERIRHVMGGALSIGGSLHDYLGQLATTPVEAGPEPDSYLWQHTFQHPGAPQGRLPAIHMAHVISVLANHEKEGSARIPETVEPGLTLHYYDLFDPRMQNALAVTGREACALWKPVRSSYERSVTGKSYLVTPQDVLDRLRAAAGIE